MPNRVVVGAQWGDEGKAKIVDFLTEEADLVIRFQGGANAGHTVEVGDQKFIFHLIPAGIMHPGKQCVIGNGVVLDPAQVLNEIDEVRSKGFDLDGRLWIAENAQVVLPYHKVLDQLKEKAAGKAAIGTTGRGIGPAYYDKVNRTGIRVGDLLEEASLREKLTRHVASHNETIQKMYGGEPLSADAIFAEYRELGRRIAPYVADTVAIINSALKQGKRLIFEGAQGTVLDVDHGTYPFVTSSNTVAAAACVGSGVGPTAIQQVIGVVKAYTTRVGNGPFPTEELGAIGKELRLVGHEYGATTGRERRCGWFDAVLVRRAAMVNGLTHLAITKMDVMDAFDEIQVCTHYELDGRRLDQFPSQISAVERVKPIYETMPGWKSPTVEVREWKDLPENARKYLTRIADLLEVPIGIISLGPKRHQTIQLEM
ncbi:MAG: adenylosuccinate synthetase [Fibrobacteres bacterium]|nr:adenylosuccinate synthetase [Fibrobacterota bacterium]